MRCGPVSRLPDYVRFLSLTGTLNLDWGVRSEFEQKARRQCWSGTVGM